MNDRITMDGISLSSQFEDYCQAYQDRINQANLVKQELKEWDIQHKKLEDIGNREDISKHFYVNDEIRKRYNKAIEKRDIYACILADFVFENKDLLIAALQLDDKKNNLSLRANHMRRGR